MTKKCRRSKIQWDNQTFLTPTRLQKDITSVFLEQFHFWSSFPNQQNRSKNRQFIHEVIIPRKFNRDLGTRAISRLKEEIRVLIETQYPSSKHDKRRFGRHRNVQDVAELSSFFSGFRLQKGVVIKLERRLKKVTRRIMDFIQLIDSLEIYNGNVSKLKRQIGMTPRKIFVQIKKILERNSQLNKKATDLFKILDLAKAVYNLTQNHNETFKTIKYLEECVRAQNSQLIFSTSSLYRVFRMQGFRWKKNVFRVNQNDKAKDARCHFLREYVRVLSDTLTEVFYFDWTSFSQNNFQLRS